MKGSKLRLILVVAVVALVLALSLQNAVTAQLPPSQQGAEETLLPLVTAPPETDASSAQDVLPAALETAPAEPDDAEADAHAAEPEDAEALPEDGVYDQKDDVARYLLLYGRLPRNYITKKEARALGWEGGSLKKYAGEKCIGGDRFGNYEGLLPERKGRSYTECDIDTLGASSRGGKRIVFSNDGLIYYTDDHYGSFTLLYGEES